MDYIDLGDWRDTEARISSDLRPIFGDSAVAPLWRVTNLSVHILYSSCAQHAVAGPCSHTEDEHILMWLGGRVLTNTLAAVRLLLVGYYGPSTALVRDSVETTMLLGLFDAEPEELTKWCSLTDSKERWKSFSPRAVKKKLTALNAYHNYEVYDLYSGMAGHPTPTVSRVYFSDARQRKMIGPFADQEAAKGTLHAVALSASHGAYQIVDLLKVQERFAGETKALDAALDEWIRNHRDERERPI